MPRARQKCYWCHAPSPIDEQSSVAGRLVFLQRLQAPRVTIASQSFHGHPTGDRPEADLLRLARQRGVKGIANLVAHRRITDVAEFRLDIWRALFLPRSTECGIIVFAVFFAISTAQFPFWVIKQAPWLERRPESVEKAEIGQDWKETLL